MTPRQIILHLVEMGANRKQALDLFKEHGYGRSAAVFYFTQYGVNFPHEYEYTDLNPSPDRKKQLQELSVSY